MTATSAVPAEQDPFLFDPEQLHTMARASAIHRGLGDFKENRVIQVDRDQSLLRASVEDEES
jgi:hypothetical protein